MTSLAPLPAHRDTPSASTPVIVHKTYDHIAFLSRLCDLLAAAPSELRTVNLHDPFTFASGNCQTFDDVLEDCTEVYGDGDDIETGYDLLEYGP